MPRAGTTGRCHQRLRERSRERSSLGGSPTAVAAGGRRVRDGAGVRGPPHRGERAGGAPHVAHDGPHRHCRDIGRRSRRPSCHRPRSSWPPPSAPSPREPDAPYGPRRRTLPGQHLPLAPPAGPVPAGCGLPPVHHAGTGSGTVGPAPPPGRRPRAAAPALGPVGPLLGSDELRRDREEHPVDPVLVAPGAHARRSRFVGRQPDHGHHPRRGGVRTRRTRTFRDTGVRGHGGGIRR
jgi:hypothetical protein